MLQSTISSRNGSRKLKEEAMRGVLKEEAVRGVLKEEAVRSVLKKEAMRGKQYLCWNFLLVGVVMYIHVCCCLIRKIIIYVSLFASKTIL